MKDLETGGVGENMPEIEMIKPNEGLYKGSVAKEELPLAKAAVRDRIYQRAKTVRRLRERLEGTDPTNAVDLTVINRLRKKLKRQMKNFQRLIEHDRAMVKRRYFTLTGEAPLEEVVDKMISEVLSEHLLQMVDCSHGGKVIDTFFEIQYWLDVARESEKCLLKLHQTSFDLAVIKEKSAAHYAKCGFKELNSANIYQASSLKWFCITIMLLLLLVLLVVIRIAINLGKA